MDSEDQCFAHDLQAVRAPFPNINDRCSLPIRRKRPGALRTKVQHLSTFFSVQSPRRWRLCETCDGKDL